MLAHNQIDNGNQLDLKVSISYYNASESKKTKVKVYKGDTNYFLVKATNLPKKWEGMKAVFKFKGTSEESPVTLVTSYLAEKDQTISSASTDKVMIESLDYEVKLRESSIKENQNKIKTLEDRNRITLSKIESLKEDEEFQTESQFKDTNNQIDQIKSNIETNKFSMEGLNKEIEEWSKQIDKLVLKRGKMQEEEKIK